MLRRVLLDVDLCGLLSREEPKNAWQAATIIDVDMRQNTTSRRTACPGSCLDFSTVEGLYIHHVVVYDHFRAQLIIASVCMISAHHEKLFYLRNKVSGGAIWYSIFIPDNGGTF